MRRLLIGSALAAGIAGCSLLTTEFRSLSVGVGATPTTAAPGDTIVFAATVQGTNLSSVSMDYADGTGDLVSVTGVTSGRAVFHKAYSAKGTFSVVARVSDLSGTFKAASVVITIQ